MRLLLTATCAAALVASARVQEPAPELKYVPPGAFAVAHVRVGELLRDPSTRNSKGLLLKRLPGALVTFNGQFQPSPMSYDRVTVFSTTEVAGFGGAPKPEPAEAEVGVIVRCSAPFDAALVAAGFGPDAKPVLAHGKTVLADDGYALCVLDDRTLIVGHLAAVTKALAPAAGAKHAMGEALAATQAGNVFTLGLRFGPGGRPAARGEFDPFYGARSAVASYSAGPEPALKVAVRFADADKATEALEVLAEQAKAMRKTVEPRREQARQLLEGVAPDRNVSRPKGPRDLREMGAALDGLTTLALIEWFDALVETPPFTQDGDALTLAQPVHPLIGRLAAPALLYAAFAAPSASLGAQPFQFPGLGLVGARVAAVDNNLKQIGLAMHANHDARGTLPPSFTKSPAGRPLHSWRVMVLPFIEEQKLYQQFKLDEPFDSAHNLKVVADNPMPRVFALPGVTKPTDKVTHFQVFTGAETIFDPAKQPSKLLGINDGTSNTILVALAAKPVPWTRPDDIAFDPKLDMRRVLLQLGPNAKPVAERGVYKVVFADGAMKNIRGTIDQETLRRAITASGGEVFTID